MKRSVFPGSVDDTIAVSEVVDVQGREGGGEDVAPLAARRLRRRSVGLPEEEAAGRVVEVDVQAGGLACK